MVSGDGRVDRADDRVADDARRLVGRHVTHPVEDVVDHGDDTTLRVERPYLAEWLARGW